jgi:hypothetical protein
MNAFISYSTALDQIIALRLQTIAAVYGVNRVYVPPATTRQSMAPELLPEVQKQLSEADVVMAVITQQPAPSALSEMNWAVAMGKLLIPIVGPNVPPDYYAQFKRHFIVDPEDPSRAERQIVQFLAEQQEVKTNRTALLALSTMAVALLLFAADSK